MEIRRVRVLRGPNIWARFPVIEALVDLQEFKDTSSDAIPGFNDRVMQWLPTMIEHRCGPGVRGGFFRRLKSGTWMGHILEHVVLEIQSLAYKDAGYGKARETSEEGVYRVAFRYRDEAIGLACLETAFSLCMSAAYDEPFNIEAELAKLRTFARQVRLPEVSYQILMAARERDIPGLRLNQSGVLQLGYGRNQRKLIGLTTDRTPLVAQQTAADPELVETLLKSIQVNASGEAVGALHRLVVVGSEVVVAVRVEDGTLTDVTTQVHDDIRAQVRIAARIVGLDIAGVDLQAVDVAQPLAPQQGAILAVRCDPDLDQYLASQALIERVAAAVVDYLFPAPSDGRIPIACVTGVNGKTTTTRLLTQLVAGAGYKTGMTCTDGVFVDGQRIEAGDCSGPKSVRNILRHAEIEAAVFEVAGGGILREGLGFDRADVSVVTNIGEGDHLGMQYINTAEDLAYVKSTVVDVVKPEVGTAVLNAADPLTAAMQAQCRGKVTYFALNPEHPVIVAHREAGGSAATVKDGQLILARGADETAIMPLAEIPLTRGGRIGFQIENVLAASAAAWALGISRDVIRRELAHFDSNMAQTPGRFNVVERDGSVIIFDYGHNPSAIVSLIESIERFPHARRTVVYGADGDRRDDQITRQAELLGTAFDRVILYEKPSRRRGRAEGECYRLLEAGLVNAPRATQVERIDGEIRAIETALTSLKSGELLLVQVDAVDADLAFIEQLLTRPSV
jgi:cyanophycin synthetase